MRLYIVRHGHAADAINDSKRPLTESGRSKIEALANILATHQVQPEQILHSPKLRATQTATILADQLKPSLNQAQSDMLPNDSIQPILDLILVQTLDTMLVGHLPYINDLAHALTGAHCNFEPGQCISLIGARDNWVIEWSVLPEFF